MLTLRAILTNRRASTLCQTTFIIARKLNSTPQRNPFTKENSSDEKARRGDCSSEEVSNNRIGKIHSQKKTKEEKVFYEDMNEN